MRHTEREWAVLSKEEKSKTSKGDTELGPAWSFLKWLNSNNSSYRSVYRIMVARLYFVCAFFVHIIRNKSQQKLIKARTKARHSLTRAHAITLKRWQIVCGSCVCFFLSSSRPPALFLPFFVYRYECNNVIFVVFGSIFPLFFGFLFELSHKVSWLAYMYIEWRKKETRCTRLIA